ncbi:MAG: DedA family protein [Chitinophagales bacterium]
MIVLAEIQTLTQSITGQLNPESLIRNGGLLLIMLLVFAQTGLFFCFFLPGGSLLFTTGVMAASGVLHQDIFTISAALIAASFSGTITGYWFGRTTGPLLYQRRDSAFFKKQHLAIAEAFYKKYGVLALTIGLFFPVIRTFAPIIAGLIKVHFGRFLLLTFFGSALWILAMVLPGYYLGSLPFLKDYLPWIVIAIIVIVTIPAGLRIIKEFRVFKKQEEDKQKEHS